MCFTSAAPSPFIAHTLPFPSRHATQPPSPHFCVHCFDLVVIEKRWLIDCPTDRAWQARENTFALGPPLAQSTESSCHDTFKARERTHTHTNTHITGKRERQWEKGEKTKLKSGYGTDSENRMRAARWKAEIKLQTEFKEVTRLWILCKKWLYRVFNMYDIFRPSKS